MNACFLTCKSAMRIVNLVCLCQSEVKSGTLTCVFKIMSGLRILSYFHWPFFLNKFIYFIYFWLHWVFVAARELSVVAVSWGYSSLRCAGFSLRWLLLLQSMGSRRAGFSSCGSRALERRLSSCGARA